MKLRLTSKFPEEKSALITGASEGIGRVFAKQLALLGYRVTVVARNKKRLAQLVSELGVGHDYLVADLSNRTDLKTVSRYVSLNQFNLLVNNAGLASGLSLIQDGDIEWVSIHNPLHWTLAEAIKRLPGMIEREAKEGGLVKTTRKDIISWATASSSEVTESLLAFNMQITIENPLRSEQKTWAT